ncbi:hypothetical protein GCM10009760_13720 [Kitasatospora kazusensis]|uniref:Uncharacterized protein n=1 Tax=Kitasatospora kazusensis TaxID=407974 RepID=A0ABN2Z1E8_9ACTN
MNDGAQDHFGWGPTAGQGATPDWAALADQHQQDAQRRKQRRVIGAVVGGVLAVGGLTATAVAVTGHGKGAPGRATVALGGTAPAPAGSPAADPGGVGFAPAPASASASAGASGGASASASASGSATAARPSAGGTAPDGQPAPQPSAPGAGPGGPTPDDPLTVISSAGTDTAPLNPAALFPDRTLTVGGQVWTQVTTATTDPCWRATTGGLGEIADHGCRTVLRATYASGHSAVTVGVAVYDQRSQADAGDRAYQGQLQGLVTQGSIAFCVTPGCVNTHAAVGRYGYFTVSGTLRPGGDTADATASAAGPGFADYVRGRLLARGH